MPAGWLPWVMINTVTNIDTLRKFVALKFRRYKLNLKVIPNLKLSGFTFRTFKLLSARRLSECSKERAAANNNWLSHEVKLASKRRQPPVQELFLRRRSNPPRPSHCQHCPFLPLQHCFPPKNTAEEHRTENRGTMPLPLWLCTYVCLLPQGGNVMYSEMYT